MSDEHWLEKAANEGRLDKIVEETDREYAAGEAHDTLEPSPAQVGNQASDRSLYRMVRALAESWERTLSEWESEPPRSRADEAQIYTLRNCLKELRTDIGKCPNDTRSATNPRP